MAAGPWLVFDSFLDEKNKGTHVMGGTPDIFKVALAAEGYVPNLATNAIFADVTNEVGETNTGYTAGGQAEVVSLDTAIDGEVTIDIVTPEWIAGIATLVCATAIIYNTSKANKLVGYCQLDNTVPGTPANVTTANGITLQIDTSDGIYNELRT